MKCKYCGNETNPKVYGRRIYDFTPKFCSVSCKGNFEDMQTDNNKITQLLKRCKDKF